MPRSASLSRAGSARRGPDRLTPPLAQEELGESLRTSDRGRWLDTLRSLLFTCEMRYIRRTMMEFQNHSGFAKIC
jgi:hypothetical protein